MKQKKIMILGSGYNFCSLVNAAKKNNMFVVVCDGRTNGKAKDLADTFYQVDMQDLEQLERIAQKEEVDGIITSFSDITVKTCVELTSKMNLKSLFNKNNIDKFFDKYVMREIFAQNDILAPKHQLISNVNDEIHLKYPLVAKPLQGSGSKGIVFLNNHEEFRRYCNDSIDFERETQKQILIEERIFGDEILIQAWIENGEPYINHIGDRVLFYPYENCPGQTNYNAFPSKFLELKKTEAYYLIKKLANIYEMENGILSVQAIVDNEGKMFMIEAMPRLTGGQDHLVQKQKTGVDMCEILVKYAVNDKSYREKLEEINIVCNVNEYYFFVPLMCKSGIIGRILLEQQYNKNYVTYIDIQASIGDYIEESKDMRQIKARIHGRANSRQEIIKRVNEIRETSEIVDLNGVNLIIPVY